MSVSDYNDVVPAEEDRTRCVRRLQLLHQLLREEEDERVLVHAVVLAIVPEETRKVLVPKHGAPSHHVM